MSILILEGADATGKSSHAEWHRKYNGATVIHAGAPTHVDWYDEYVKPLWDRGDENIVLDRWHLGEMVWPKVFNRPSLFDDRTFNLCNEALADLGARIKIVWRAPNFIEKTLRERGELDQLDNVLRGQDAFLDLLPKIKTISVEIVESDVLERNI